MLLKYLVLGVIAILLSCDAINYDDPHQQSPATGKKFEFNAMATLDGCLKTGCLQSTDDVFLVYETHGIANRDCDACIWLELHSSGPLDLRKIIGAFYINSQDPNDPSSYLEGSFSGNLTLFDGMVDTHFLITTKDSGGSFKTNSTCMEFSLKEVGVKANSDIPIYKIHIRGVIR